MNCQLCMTWRALRGIRCFLFLPETAGSPRRTPKFRQPVVCRGGARNDKERFYSCLTPGLRNDRKPLVLGGGFLRQSSQDDESRVHVARYIR
jgi:hypothetical protein